MENSGKIFGVLPNGQKVLSYMLRSSGIEMTVLNYGCIITSLKVDGGLNKTDVVLGFDNIENYIAARDLPAPPYFGAIIGRYCGRIKNGIFLIDGKEFHLNANNNGHTLHGGNKGFDQVLWTKVPGDTNDESITFRYVSPAGDENFPGELTTEVTYTVSNNEVIIEYSATTSEDTVANFTQHSYFNLDGHDTDLCDQQLFINTDQLLEIDSQNIPSGKIIKAVKKDADFTKGDKSPFYGIDDTFIIENPTLPAATLISTKNNVRLTVTSDQPALHIYVGGSLFGKMLGKEGAAYHTHSGICFESQNYPDAPNHPHFPNSVLRKGAQYMQKTIWRFDRPN